MTGRFMNENPRAIDGVVGWRDFYSNSSELWFNPRRMTEKRDNLSHRPEQLTISNRVEDGGAGFKFPRTTYCAPDDTQTEL